jgi:hypothetical protein
MVKKTSKAKSPSFSSDDGSDEGDFSFDNKDGFATMENEVYLDDDGNELSQPMSEKEETPEEKAA